MSKKKVKTQEKVVWYDNPNMLTSFIIGLIALIVLLCQSFAIKNELEPMTMLGSVLNHTITYLLAAIYFIALKTKLGKKYFDFLNIFLIILYVVSTVTSTFTVFTSFGLASLLGLMIDVLLLIYLFHTLLRSSRLWDSASLGKSPFNEISNHGYYNTILVLAMILLAVELISSTSIDGTILSLLDTLYIGLFTRYICIYGEFLDSKKIAVNNEGNFDEIKAAVKEEVSGFVEEYKLDEKYEDVKEKLTDAIENVSEKVQDIKDDIKEKIDDAELEEKFDKVKNKVSDFASDVKEEIIDIKDDIVDAYHESDLDEKVEEVKTKTKEVVSNITNDLKEEITDIKEDIDKKLEETDIDDNIKEFIDDSKDKIITAYKDSKLEKTIEKVKDKTVDVVDRVKPKKDISSRKKAKKKSTKKVNK